MKRFAGRALRAAAAAAMLAAWPAGRTAAQDSERLSPDGMVPPAEATDRRSYEQKAEMELTHLETLIRDLETRSLQAERSERDRADRAVRELRDKKDVARDALNELRAQSEERWGAQKGRVDFALQDLRESYDRARDVIR